MKLLDLFRTTPASTEILPAVQATLPAVAAQTLPSAEESRAVAQRPTLKVGDEVPVGHFFWIKTGIGFAENARHGHGIDLRETTSPGSANEDCKVRILRIDGNYATVVLLRPEIPYGAPAPHGTIFVLPVEEILSWPALVKERARRQCALAELRRQVGRVVV